MSDPRLYMWVLKMGVSLHQNDTWTGATTVVNCTLTLYCQRPPLLYCQRPPLLYCQRPPLLYCQRPPLLYCQRPPLLYCKRPPLLYCQRPPLLYCQRPPLMFVAPCVIKLTVDNYVVMYKVNEGHCCNCICNVRLCDNTIVLTTHT